MFSPAAGTDRDGGPPPLPLPQQHSIPGADATIFDQSIPGFTAEEEMREIRSLSNEEIAAVQADLIGLNAAMGSLAVGGSACAAPSFAAASASATSVSAAATAADSPAQLSADVIARIGVELDRLPSGETAAYRLALQLCPDQVVDPRRVQMFLDHAAEEEREGNSNGSTCNNNMHYYSDACIRSAAGQVAQYWKIREKVFNGAHPNTAFLPMTQAGALTAAGGMNLATRRVYELLPTPDASGRSVIFISPHRRDYAQYTACQEIAGFWYLIETVMEDPDKWRKGVVWLVDARHMTRQQSSREALSYLLKMTSALPIAIKAMHICYPNSLIHHIMLPIFKRLVFRKLRLRTVAHRGTTNEVLTSLSAYCFPANKVPTDLGGSLELNSTSWMLNRLATETVRANPSLESAVQDGTWAAGSSGTAPSAVAVGLISNAAAARADSHTPPQESDQSPKLVDHHPNVSDVQLYNKLMKARRPNGNKGDPRMNQAFLICLEDPDLPHLDALLQCGFDFSPLSRKELETRPSRTVKDAQNTTLKQRYDQLSRRLRMANGSKKRGKRASSSDHTSHGALNMHHHQRKEQRPESIQPLDLEITSWARSATIHLAKRCRKDEIPSTRRLMSCPALRM